MGRTLQILFAIGMLVLGVGFVRPKASQMIEDAWRPVTDGLVRVPARENELFRIEEAGTYVLFLEGPAEHTVWDDLDVWVQLLDRRGKDVLKSQTVEYDYRVASRRGSALVQIKARVAGSYNVSLSGSDSETLTSGGFELGLVRADIVQSQSKRATKLLIGGVAIGAALVFFLLIGLSQRA